MRTLYSGLLLTTFILAGCTTVGPDYIPPQAALPTHWTEQPSSDTTTDDPSVLQSWWKSFHDPILDRLVAQAIANNYDLRIAEQRLLAARAERDSIASARRPTIGASGTAEALRSSTTLDWPPGAGESQTFQAGFDASWEIDVFGGVRRSVEAANAGVGAVAEGRRAVLVSLLAEVASDYAGLRSAQERLAIAERSANALRESLSLADRARRQGAGTDFDVAQARAELDISQARIPALKAEIARGAHAIGILVGGFPGDLEPELKASGQAMPMPPMLPVSIPSEVVRNRPDIRAAERRLAASTARIGIAVADLFPHFRIPLSIGSATSDLGGLFSGASTAWSVALTGTQTLYDGGRSKALIRAAEAVTEADRLAYERSIRVAFRDVEDALINIETERDRHTALVAAVADSDKALDQATRLYRSGLSSYLKVLIAQRAVFQAEDQLAESDSARIRNMIALSKALGGGWQDVYPAGEA